MRFFSGVAVLVLAFCATAHAQTAEGKKIIGGHGHAMPTTYHLKKYSREMQRAPLDGVLVCVNRNEYAGDEKWREIRPHNWFRSPALTIADVSIALAELASTDLGRFKHNMLWCSGSRRFPGDWFDDDVWENLILNNARVLAEVYKRGKFEALWFDVEVGGGPPGGVMTWKGTSREKKHTFEEYEAKARQRGRELMQTLTSVVPDFKLVISHAYGMNMRLLYGRSTAELREINYSLLPAFCDGVLEGCGDRGQLIESGEGTYGTMTYASYLAWRKWERLAARKLSKVPELLAKHYRYAMAMWIDFEARNTGWHKDDLEQNHFSPERMKRALHNAMSASDEFVWTYSIHAHWWPNRVAVHPEFDKTRWRPTPADRKNVLGDAYMAAIGRVREPMDLAWHPGRTDERGAIVPAFDLETAFAELADDYETLLELDDGWLFYWADSLSPLAIDWGASPLHFSEVLDGRPIKLGDAWENQGVRLDGIGIYRRNVRLPDRAREKRIYLGLGGVAGKATVYVAHQGVRPKSVGRTQGESVAIFDITGALDFEGDNSLTIVVDSRQGVGGIYGVARILATEKGKQGYVELRGKETGTWFHWFKRHGQYAGQSKSFVPPAKEHTLEARVRVPGEDQQPFTASLWCATKDGGWTVQFSPSRAALGGEWIANNSTQWHVYRIVTARDGDQYVQRLFIDGEEKVTKKIDPMKPEKPRHPSIGFGVGWGRETTPPIKMDLDYLRWANRPFTPEDERIAARNVPEAELRKDVFWDDAYEGDALPQTEHWVWWYDNDPRPYTHIAYFKEAVDIDDESRLDSLYDWQAAPGARGGRLVVRDAPRLGAAGAIHGSIEPGTIDAGGARFAAKLTLLSADKANWGWPAVTLTDLAVKDWSTYAAVAVRLHNPTDKVQKIGFSIRDSDRNVWHRLETFAPGETRVLAATIEQLRAKVLISDVKTVTLCTKQPTAPQMFLLSPVFLVKP